MAGPRLTWTLLEGVADVPAAAWDACAGTGNPFIRHAFLDALERSGSATAEAGWRPCHLAAFDGAGGLGGCVPLYLKSHSYGEYVFDHGWANAFEQAGGRYYPKLQAAVPFTPVTGPRLLTAPGAEVTTPLLAQGLIAAGRSLGVSSVHVTFCTEAEATALKQAGFLLRQGTQYHWTNAGYTTFDDFLGALSSRKRKSIRRERREVDSLGITNRVLTGPMIEEAHWDAFWRFYQDTSSRKWGRPYLTRDFFARLGARMSEDVALVLAEQDGEPVAGALNLIGADTLFGRNWGTVSPHVFLHFETCYYQAIDFAIAKGLKRVEAGAQGEHKIARGYLPVPTWSAHWIFDPSLRRAVSDFLERETQAIEEERAALMELSPYRCNNTLT